MSIRFVPKADIRRLIRSRYRHGRAKHLEKAMRADKKPLLHAPRRRSPVFGQALKANRVPV
jgi:hypothetical protein